MKRVGTVYKLTNVLTGSEYIGATARYKERKLEHLSLLRRGAHSNINVQKDFDFFGEEVFSFSVVARFEGLDKMFMLEENLIKKSTSKNTYNITVGSMNTLARHPHKEKILEERRLKTFGEGNPNWRGGVSQASCIVCGASIGGGAEKCSECYFKERDVSGENNPFFNKTHSAETKKLLSERKKGKATYNSRAVIANGVRYETMGEASRQLGVHITTLVYWLNNDRPKYSEYYFEEEL